MNATEPTTRTARIEAILARVFVALAVAVVTFLLADRISAALISSRSPIEQKYPVRFSRQPRPYTMFSGAAGQGGLNVLGYPGPAPRVPKPAAEYRVFMLGGSTVHRGDPPLAALLEMAFAEHGAAHVRVYNFGVISSNSTMDLIRLLVEITDLDPDLVIMYNGGNDILHPWSWDPRPGYPFNFIVYENNPLLESDVRAYPSTAMLAYGSNLMRIAFGSRFVEAFVPLDAERERCAWGSDAWRDEIVRIYLGNVHKATVICTGIGARFAAFFQPLYYFEADQPGAELPTESVTGHAVAIRRAVRAAVTAGEAPNLVDLSGVYAGTAKAAFKGSIHTSQEYKPVVAEAMYRHLSDSMGLPPAPEP